MKNTSQNDIIQVFYSWLTKKDGGNKTIKTANEYIRRISRISDMLYANRRQEGWQKLLTEGMYPVLLIHELCSKKWNDPAEIKIGVSYDYVINGGFISSLDRKLLKQKIYKAYLMYVWQNKEERSKNQVAVYALLNSTRQNNYFCLQTNFKNIIETKLDYIKRLTSTKLSFECIEATKTKPMKILSINGSTVLAPKELKDFFKCSRNTIQNLVNKGEIHYSSAHLFSIQDINIYLAQKHSAFMKKTKKRRKIEKDISAEYVKNMLLLYEFYKITVDTESYGKFIEYDDSNLPEEDLQVRNDIIKTFNFFKKKHKILNDLNLDDDFVSLMAFFGENQEYLPQFETDVLSEFVKIYIKYCTPGNDEEYAKLASYLTALAEYIKKAMEDLKDKKWYTLNEAKEATGFTKKKIQGLRDRKKITYTQYSKKIIKYLKSDIQDLLATKSK